MTTATPTIDSATVQATITAGELELAGLELKLEAGREELAAAGGALTALEADRLLGGEVSTRIRAATERRTRATQAVAALEADIDHRRALLAELTSRERSARNIELEQQRQEVETSWREAYSMGAEHLAAFAAAARELLRLKTLDEQVARTLAQLDAPGAYIARGRLGRLRSQLIYIDDLDERDVQRLEAIWQHMALPEGTEGPQR